METQTLQHRAHECLVRLQQAEAAKAGVDEAALLQSLQKELADAAKPLHAAYAKAKIMMVVGIHLPLPENTTKKQTVANVAIRFRENPAAATLKQGRRWPTLIAAVKDIASVVELSVIANWQAYVSTNLFAGPPPEQEESSLANTPTNRQALQAYRKLFQEFSRLRLSPPTTPETLARLRELSEELAAIQFQREVPQSIRDFLDATNTLQGAALSLLTEEVRTWLSSNNLLGSYVIRAKLS